jgi:hypothetical protein
VLKTSINLVQQKESRGGGGVFVRFQLTRVFEKNSSRDIFLST